MRKRFIFSNALLQWQWAYQTSFIWGRFAKLSNCLSWVLAEPGVDKSWQVLWNWNDRNQNHGITIFCIPSFQMLYCISLDQTSFNWGGFAKLFLMSRSTAFLDWGLLFNFIWLKVFLRATYWQDNQYFSNLVWKCFFPWSRGFGSWHIVRTLAWVVLCAWVGGKKDRHVVWLTWWIMSFSNNPLVFCHV